MASQRTDINTGVSQGSLFSPTCFLIYINDLPKKNLRFLVSIYADDSTVYWCPSKYLGNQCLPVDLALIAQWEKNWLPITFHHHHHHQADLKPAPILMSDHTLKQASCLENLLELKSLSTSNRIHIFVSLQKILEEWSSLTQPCGWWIILYPATFILQMKCHQPFTTILLLLHICLDELHSLVSSAQTHRDMSANDSLCSSLIQNNTNLLYIFKNHSVHGTIQLLGRLDFLKNWVIEFIDQHSRR